MKINKTRNLKTYSSDYLKKKDGILKWRNENKEYYVGYMKEYMRDYYTKNRLMSKKTVFWNNIKTRMRNFGSLTSKQLINFKKETGINWFTFIAMHDNVMVDYIFNEKTNLEISHAIGKKKLKELGLLNACNHYSNIEIITKEKNRMYHSTCTVSDKKKYENILSLIRDHDETLTNKRMKPYRGFFGKNIYDDATTVL